MKFGLMFVNVGPFGLPDHLENLGRCAEEAGIESAFTVEHVVVPKDYQSEYPYSPTGKMPGDETAPIPDPVLPLAFLAAVTEKLRLGTGVMILPQRHPAYVAKQAATLDTLSGGRAILGVGIGWAQEEFAGLGVEYKRRGAITNEYLEAIKLLWTQDLASYEGRYVSFKDVDTAPRPLRSPHIPIWVGGPSDAALRRAVRYGDAWHPIRMRMDWFKNTGIPRLQEIAAEEGRPVPALCPRVKLHVTGSPMPEEERVVGEGTLDQIHRDMAELESIGCEYVLLDTYLDDPEALRKPEDAWKLYADMAKNVLDLGNQTVR